MFGSIMGGTPIIPHSIDYDPLPTIPTPGTSLVNAADYLAGLVPMSTAPEPVRAPPPFPLSAYLVMKRAE
jgi:hypothetical protein